MRASISRLFCFNYALICPRCVVSSDGHKEILPSVQFKSDLFMFFGLLRMTALVLVGLIVTLDCLAYYEHNEAVTDVSLPFDS